MLNISTALFLLNRGRLKNSLKRKPVFTEYFPSLKLVGVPWGSKLNILKFPPQFVYNHEKKKNTAASGTDFVSRHTSTKKCCAFARTLKGRGRGSLNFVDPTVKSTILTAGPGKQKKNKEEKESISKKNYNLIKQHKAGTNTRMI